MSDIQQEVTSQPAANVAQGEALSNDKDSTQTVTAEVQAEVQEKVSSGLSDLLSADLKEVKALQNFKDVDGLAKSYVHLNGLLGKKFEELSPDELEGFYSKLGRPDSSAGYSLPDSPNDELVNWYKDKAFDLGLNQNQTRKLMDSYTEIEAMKIKEAQDAQTQVTQGWLEEIKKDFGGTFEKRVEVAKKAVHAYGGDELKDYLNKSGLGNHPAMVKAFAKIGRELLEDRMTESDASRQFGLTPQEALHKVATLKRDPDFMKSYKSAMAPGHAESVQEIQDLYKIAYPNT